MVAKRAGRCWATRLEVEFDGQLDLAGVVDGAGRAVERVGRALAVVGKGAALAAERGCIGRAEVGSTVDGVEEADVGGVEEVEGFGEQLEAAALLELEG